MPSEDLSAVVLSAQQQEDSDEHPVNEPMCIDVEPNTTIIDHLKTAFTKIEEMYKYHPDVLGPSVEAFYQQVDKIATAGNMQSALCCFGKYSGAATTLVSGKRRHFVSLKTIGVQPTAVARRKMAVGGRRRMYLGRPPRAAYATEHGYAVNTGIRRHVMPRHKAPHCLAAAVDNIESVGTTHSAK